MKLMLFDVDLTLVNTGGAGLRALDRAFGEILDIENVTDGVSPDGKTDTAIIREVCHKSDLLDVTRIEPLVDRLLESYVHYREDEVANSQKYRVLPGILEILAEMRERGDVLTGLATGNVEVGARIKLERGGLNGYFPFGGFGSDSEDRSDLVRKAGRAGAEWRRVRIEPDDTFVIGDTPRDVAAGREAGFRTVGVATGRYNIEELEASRADLVISDFESGRDQFLRSTRMT